MSATAGHEKIGAVQAEAERWSAEEVLRWGLAEFHPRAAIASSFGAEDVALIDIAVRVRRTFVYSHWTRISFSRKPMN